MFKRHFSFILICFVLLYSCKPSTVDYKSKIAHPDIFHNSVKSVTDVIVHDIFSPPVASRIYTYCSIGAYEAVRYKNPEQYPSLAKQIIHLDSFPKPLKGEIYDFEAVGSLTYLMIGKSLIFSEDSIQNKINELLALYSASGMPNDVLNRSQDFAQKITNHITQWYAKNNYKKTRYFPKHSIQNYDAT